MKKLLIISMIALILVAGCVNQTGGGETSVSDGKGYGLEVTEFTLTPADEVVTNRTVSVRAKVENIGLLNVKANEAFILLLRTFETETEATANSGTWRSAPNTAQAQNITREMKPATSNRPATTETFDWRLRSPYIEGTQEITDDIGVKLFYEYRTDAHVDLTLYPQEQTTVPTSKTRITIDKETPIEFEVTLGRDPVGVEFDGDGFEMNIIARNVGGGEVYRDKSINYTDGSILPGLNSEDVRGRMNLVINPPGNLIFEDPECYKNIDLYFQDTDTANCYVNVVKKPAATTKIGFDIKASYMYANEYFDSIVIKGKR